jgi:hypothetical protein
MPTFFSPFRATFIIVTFIFMMVTLGACSQSTPTPSITEVVSTNDMLEKTDSPEVVETEAQPEVLTATQTEVEMAEEATSEPDAQDSKPSSANVIVQIGPGKQFVREINFVSEISGLAALELTGLEIISKDHGDGFIAICSIAEIGCPEENCFCDADNFWNYAYWDGDKWQGYQTGAADSKVASGAIDGWRWGAFDDGSLAAAPQTLAANEALKWLQGEQITPSGGYDSESNSVEALFAIGANGYKASEWKNQPERPSLHDYWIKEGPGYSQLGAAESGKLAVGLASAQGCWPSSAKPVIDYYDPATGIFDPEPGFQAWGMLGAIAMGSEVPARSNEYLKGLTQPDGGWEWNTGFGSDTNSTALAIQVLIQNGEPNTSSVIINGLNYLKSAQNTDGGFTYQPDSEYGTDSDSNSTAYAVQAIIAAGGDTLEEAWTVEGNSPVDYLRRMQLENGSVEWQPDTGANFVATAQAIPALLGKPLFLIPATLPLCPE